ncbi:MAG: D-tyrosyl-tRNA(Tyr) deacylase [Acidobacteriia bacterium]|nr:D-tyrosyl-tRNA(Tyr) deacylase [Terriglobia bacterium]
MRAVIQRVKESKVVVNDQDVANIGKGLLVLLAVMKDDTEEDARHLAQKIIELRIFEDENGKMNRSLQEVSGAMLVVSQFTLAGDCRKGRRPSFDGAADPVTARSLYGQFVENVRSRKIPTQTGKFQAMMQVHLVNDGPVTLLLDSHKSF